MLLHPWDFPSKSTEVGCHFLLQRIFLTQGLNLGLPHCRQALYCLSHQGSLSAIKVMSSAYLRLLIFLQAIFNPLCDSSSSAFRIMYSKYKLNKQGENIQLWCTPFPIWNQSIVSCLVLTVASWPAYRFLRGQVRWSDTHLFKNFPQFVVIHTVKGFSVANETEVDVFSGILLLFLWSSGCWQFDLWFLCLF